MRRQPVSRQFPTRLAAIAAAAAVSAAMASACADSPRDRHLRSRQMVHHPLAEEAGARVHSGPDPDRPVASVPVGLD